LHYGLQCGLRLAHNNVTGGHWNMAMKARPDRPSACGRFIGKASRPLPRLDGALCWPFGWPQFHNTAKCSRRYWDLSLAISCPGHMFFLISRRGDITRMSRASCAYGRASVARNHSFWPLAAPISRQACIDELSFSLVLLNPSCRPVRSLYGHTDPHPALFETWKGSQLWEYRDYPC
jgi:hypothetical protein